MKKITYNLAAARKVHGLAFAVRAGALALAALVLCIIAIGNLASQREQKRTAAGKPGVTEQRLNEMRNESRRWKNEIASWGKTLAPELKEANALIEHKSFSFVSRLDFLERKFSPGIHILKLILVNNNEGRVSMTITAQSLKELFALYKELAPYELVINNETQTREEYQVRLQFKITNEKI